MAKQLEIYTRVDDRNTCHYIHRFLRINLTDEQAEMYKKLVLSIQETNGICMVSEFKGWGAWCEETKTEEGWSGHEPYDPEFDDPGDNEVWEGESRRENVFAHRFKTDDGQTLNRFNISNDMVLRDVETGEETHGFSNM